MQVLTVIPEVLSAVIAFADDPVPEAEDVKAGWLAFGVFIALILAVTFLGFSLVKQLRKAQASKDAGVYGDEPVADQAAERDEDAQA